MKIITTELNLGELKVIALNHFGTLVKAVVDIERGYVAIDAELHSDLESLLLENGSKQKDLWGINLYPELKGSDFIEFDSLINLRPSQDNRSRGVENNETRQKIAQIVAKRIKSELSA